jgi:hypothetical protein
MSLLHPGHSGLQANFHNAARFYDLAQLILNDLKTLSDIISRKLGFEAPFSSKLNLILDLEFEILDMLELNTNYYNEIISVIDKSEIDLINVRFEHCGDESEDVLHHNISHITCAFELMDLLILVHQEIDFLKEMSNKFIMKRYQKANLLIEVFINDTAYLFEPLDEPLSEQEIEEYNIPGN